MKTATPADLTAIRGITETKARQILDYVQGLKAEPPDALTLDQAVVTTSGESESAEEGSDSETLSVQQQVWKVIAAITALRCAQPERELDARLLRQVEKMLTLAERLNTPWDGTPAMENRLAGQLGKVTTVLYNAASRKRLSRQRQEKLADRLRDRRRKLNALLKGTD